MGSPKQLLVWGKDSLIVSEIKKSLQLAHVQTYVVLGAHFELIKKEIHHLSIEILFNENWKLGMGASISTGIHHILKSEQNYKAVLISLIDQPFIDLNHLNSLYSKFDENENYIVATEMKKKVGVPAIFPRKYFGELSQLKEDFGARFMIKKYRDSIIAVDGQNKTDDIDTMEQYELLFNRIKE
ncbi:NTP transferase domain-containing protein [Aquimarina litoralis]|nr:NTP transferase domain-containing protein [Aquimarina litoralis]